MLGGGFILTAMLWGAFGAKLVDRQLTAAALYVGACAVFSLFGVIHSVEPAGGLYLPWALSGNLSWRLAGGYAALAILLLTLSRFGTPHAIRKLRTAKSPSDEG